MCDLKLSTRIKNVRSSRGDGYFAEKHVLDIITRDVEKLEADKDELLDRLIDMEKGDDSQAWKEARKAIAKYRPIKLLRNDDE